MAEIKQGSVEIAGEDVDLSDLQSAYEKELSQKASMTAMSGIAPGQPQGPEMQQGPEMAPPGATNVPAA